jgi:SHS2 domain-containing protein
MKRNYELLEQTSDIRIRIFGDNLENIILNGIKAFNEVVYSGQIKKYQKILQFELRFDREDLMIVNVFSWLILQLDSYNVLINPIEILENKEERILTINYTKFIPLKVAYFNFVPKGATYNEVIFNVVEGYAEITIDT